MKTVTIIFYCSQSQPWQGAARPRFLLQSLTLGKQKARMRSLAVQARMY